MFYVLVPLLFLPKVVREFTPYLPIALWGSAAIAWLLFRGVGSMPLRIEAVVLALGSSAFTLAACASDYFGLTAMHSYWSLGIGLGFFAILGYVECAFQSVAGHPLRAILITTGYYVGGVIFAVVFAGSGSLSLAAALTAGYFAFIASGQLRSSFVRPMVAVAYLLTIVFASAAIVAAFDSDDAAIALAFYELGALCTWGYLLYRKLPAARLGRRKFGGAIVQQWCWHGLIALAYISVNGALFGDPVGPATSVCLVVHATGVLFLTLQPQWQPLVRLVVTLFVAAGLKIVLYDMADFSTVEKIVAFMVIGAVLLAAAYWSKDARWRPSTDFARLMRLDPPADVAPLLAYLRELQRHFYTAVVLANAARRPAASPSRTA